MSEQQESTGTKQGDDSSRGGSGGESTDVVVDMPSFDGDIAAMQGQIRYTEQTIDPHFEMLIGQASQRRMGGDLIGALNSARDSSATAAAAYQAALNAVEAANRQVHDAYASATSASPDRDYYRPE